MVAVAPFDWQAHDTYFIVAHLHYVLIGGMLFPVFAGLYYYYPLIGGRRMSDRVGRLAFWLMFAGMNITFFPMHIAGLRGMPRRVYTYPADIGWDWLNLISTLGAVVLGIGMFAVVADLTLHRRTSSQREQNPWNAGTLEWLNEPEENWGVRSIPQISSRYPLWEQKGLMRQVNDGEWYLADAKEGRRETLVTSVLDAEPEQVLRVGGTSYLTIISAVTLGAVFVALTFKWWLLSLASGVAFLVAVIWWLWTGTNEIPDQQEKDIGHGIRLPLYASGVKSTGWWAMFITMTGDGTAFASLVFGYFFFWTIHADFTGGVAGPGMFWPLVALGLFLLSWGATLGAREANRRGATGLLRTLLIAGPVLAVAASAAGLAGPWFTAMDPTVHVYPAIVWILVLWTVAHAATGIIMQLYCLARSFAGRMSPIHDMDIRNVTLYWHFMAVTALITFGVIGLFPEAL